MRNHVIGLVIALATVWVLASSAAVAQTGQPAGAAKAKLAGPAPKGDLWGVWAFTNPGNKYSGGQETPGETWPPLTPAAQKRSDAERPGYGPRAAPGGNDPILQCDPIGFPRILFFPTPFEFAQIPGRVLQFFERDHAWREIWTDGRSIPKDADPTWYGYSVGKWTDDYTFVADTEGLDDRTWLGAFGLPHSDQMKVHESYHRTDRNTIEFAITMDDPLTFTKPWVATPRTAKLQPKAEIPQYFCVYSEENSFAQRIRALGAKGVKGGGSFAQPH